jgi:hypothetical protein
VFFGLILPFSGIAQKSFELGFSGGITNYYGDLGHNEGFYQPNSTQPGVSVTLRNFLKTGRYTGNLYKPLSAELRFSWNRLQLDETKPAGKASGFEMRNYGRGIGFRNDLFGLSSHVTYTIYSNPKAPLHLQPAAFYIMGGVGVYYGNVKADLFRGEPGLENRYFFWPDGTIRDASYTGPNAPGNIIEKDGVYETDLSDWFTEGGLSTSEGRLYKPGSNLNIAVPLGFGIRYGLSKQLTLSAECSYIIFFTDYLDDVSNAYPSWSEVSASYPGDPIKQELAMYVADPTGWGREGLNGVPASPRGNPSTNDAYSFLSLELAYKFEFRKGIPRLWGAR